MCLTVLARCDCNYISNREQSKLPDPLAPHERTPAGRSRPFLLSLVVAYIKESIVDIGKRHADPIVLNDDLICCNLNRDTIGVGIPGISNCLRQYGSSIAIQM